MKRPLLPLLVLALFLPGCQRSELETLERAAHDHHACLARQTTLGECDASFVRLEQADIAARAAGQGDGSVQAARETGRVRAGGSPETSPIGTLYRSVAEAVEQALRNGQLLPGSPQYETRLSALLDRVCQGEGARDTRYCMLRAGKPDPNSDPGQQLLQESRVVNEVIKQKAGAQLELRETQMKQAERALRMAADETERQRQLSTWAESTVDRKKGAQKWSALVKESAGMQR